MLLVHVADLHLGKSLRERSLLEDQALMLEALLGLLARERPAALLVAGDVYDRAVPPPEAIRLFDSFLSRALEAAPDMALVVIPGNHDSAARLSFGSSLLARAGLHMRTRPADFLEPILVEREGERCAIWALPYLEPGADFGAARGVAAGRPTESAAAPVAPRPPATLRPGELPFDAAEEPAPGLASAGSAAATPSAAAAAAAEPRLRGQNELLAEALDLVRPRLLPDSPNVLLAHCFAAGGRTAESERAFVGLAEQVDAGLLDPFDYAALGHLHRPQPAGARGRYAGSPMAYSFAEAGEDRGFTLVETGPGGARARLEAYVPPRRLVRVSGLFADLAAPGAEPEAAAHHVEVLLLDPEPVLDPAESLRSNFPLVLSVRQAAFESAAAGAEADAGGPPSAATGGAAAETLPPEEAALGDFIAFHAEMRGAPPPEPLLGLFRSLASEASREAL